MSLYLERIFLNRISPQLRNFSEKGGVYNFSCPICGDSKKDSKKARGYFFEGENRLIYKCHNCGVSLSFSHFLKHFDKSLYRQFVMETLKEKLIEKNQEETLRTQFLRAKKTIELVKDAVLDGLPTIDELPKNHVARVYVNGRKCPSEKLSLIYFVENFKDWVNKVKPGFFKPDSKFIADSRILFPIMDVHGKVLGVQSRAIKPCDHKYRFITLSFVENSKERLIFGLDKVDFKKPIFVTEGIFDSLFLPNAIAVLGSSYDNPTLKSLQSRVIIVPDNEKRNREVTKNVEKMLKAGFSVAIWDNDITAKDVNEAILSGYSKEFLVKMFTNNTVSGLEGLVKYKLWQSDRS